MSKKLIALTIMSPLNSTILKAEWLDVKTDSGNFVVQPGHAPIITSLASNKELIIGLPDGTQKIIKVADGVLEVNRDTATILLTHE